LYGGKISQFIRTQVKFEDGRTGNIEADVKIRDAATYPTAAQRISA
jgi:long-chain acyl-CoA synthetase